MTVKRLLRQTNCIMYCKYWLSFDCIKMQMVGGANEGAGDDAVSDADDAANDADDAADDADDAADDTADDDVVVCFAPGSIADADDFDDACWNCLGGAHEWYATAKNTLHVVHALLLRHSISLPLPKTLGSPVVQPQSPVGAAFYQNRTSLWSGASASKIGRGVQSLIASWHQVAQDGVLRSGCPRHGVLKRQLPRSDRDNALILSLSLSFLLLYVLIRFQSKLQKVIIKIKTKQNKDAGNQIYIILDRF
jgi:hypothetical protein